MLHTYIHPFNGPLSGTTRVSWYQKGKTNLDFTEARDSEWQWHQLGHMQVCISLQTENYASTPPLSFYRPDAFSCRLPSASKHEGKLKTCCSEENSKVLSWQNVVDGARQHPQLERTTQRGTSVLSCADIYTQSCTV